jgi:5-methylcytosine-specific restriction endonuclease McrA
VKTCIKCGVEKPLEAFRPGGRGRSRGACRACEAAAQRLRYAQDPERYRAAARAYHEQNRETRRAYLERWRQARQEHCLAYSRAYYRANAEARRADIRRRRAAKTAEQRREDDRRHNSARRDYFRQRQATHGEQLRENERRWRRENPHKKAEKEARRRARLAAARWIEPVDRQQIVERDGSACYLCGRVLLAHQITLDHVVPLSKGGPHAADNLRVACRSCNCRKGVRLPHEL